MTLPGITKIEYCECASLQPHIEQQALTGAPVALSLDTTEVKFYGVPTCKWEASMLNGGREITATLQFSTSDALPEGKRLAFIVTAASGRQLLVGTREPRYPVVAYQESTGEPTGDPAARTYKITHVAMKTPVDCVI